MNKQGAILLVGLVVGILAVAAILFGSKLFGTDPANRGGTEAVAEHADPLHVAPDEGAAALPADSRPSEVRSAIASKSKGATVRGRVLDAKTLAGLPGVEVLAMRQPPSFERLVSRFRGLFRNGLWSDANEPVEILARATSGADGWFEITGLPPGMVFLDGKSERIFVRTPAAVRVAEGELKSGVELLGAAGGRIVGQVVGPDGLPASGAAINLRPGVNAFLGQITQRKYRWLEVRSDAQGRFEISGVPTGSGYTLSASAPVMALAEQLGIRVEEGQTTTVTIKGQAGASVVGRVVDAGGQPLAAANVAMVYLDISRLLFSADGRDEPITTDAQGFFKLQRVAPGRVAFAAVADNVGASNIQELAVVDGGAYEDLLLTVSEGKAFSGVVLDDQDKPIAGADLELRPMEQPTDPDMLKMALKIRQVKVKSQADGRFEARGLTGRDLMIQASKTGYVTNVRFGVKLEERDIKLTLVRGCTIKGKVALADGKPMQRFRVDTRSTEIRAPAPGTDSRPVVADAGDRRGGPPWMRGGGMRGPRNIQLREGQRLGDQGFEGAWQEIQSADGAFELHGIPPGKVRVRVRADGFLDPEAQEITLAAGQESAELAFVLAAGAIARGTVVDAVTNQPVAEAMVTAYRMRDGNEDEPRRNFPIQINADPEDLDFLGMSAMDGRRSVQTDSKGAFEMRGLSAAKYRFTARHPDKAKGSAKDVDVLADKATENVVIKLSGGGVIEGKVTGQGMRPLADALIVVGSLSAGSLKSVSSDATGMFRIEGLPGGQYVVFKSRMEEQSQNLAYDLMGNMRMKTVTVREGKTTRVDIQDDSEDGVRVFGTVRDGGQIVGRAMVTALSSDKEGLLGMGIRAKPTDAQGNYELVGLKPGSYFFQVARFQQRPEQTSLQVVVPEGVHELRLDLEIPQSYVAGTVKDRTGAPVAGVQIQAGVVDGGMTEAEGLLGLIMKNGVNQARTDEQGTFKLKAMAAGTYRLTAQGRNARGKDQGKFGDASLDDIRVDGRLPIENLVIVLPTAGELTGIVVDGNGAPVAGAEVTYSPEKRSSKPSDNSLADLFGVPMRPTKSGPDGRFTIDRVTPGKYRVRADVQGLAPGNADGVVIDEGRATDVTLKVVRGAKVRLRATNVDGSKVPLANITVLDGEGKPLASKVSVVSVMRQFLAQDEKKEDTGWHEVGNIPPDTYTVIITEKGKPEVRVTRAIKDGETFEWDIDVTQELKAAGRERK